MMNTEAPSRVDLIKMTLPLVVGSLLEPIASVIDNAFVGNLNTNWLAALAYGTMILSSVSWVFNFIIHVTTESISKVFGQGNQKDIVGLTQVTILIALIIGITTSGSMYFFRNYLFSLIGVSENLRTVTEDYFFIRLLGHPFTVLFLSSVSLLRGISKVKTTMFILFFSSGINSILNYIFLYRLSLGPEYAAWGTNISMAIGFFLAIFVHLKTIGARDIFKTRSFYFSDFLNFSNKSLNLFVRSFCLTTIYFLSTRIAGAIGLMDLAAHQILLQFWLFASFFIDGVAIVANIYVSRWANRGSEKKVKWAIKECFYQGSFFGLLFIIIYFFFKSWLWAKFTHDLEVLNILEKIWPLIVWSQLLNAMAFVVDGILFGAAAYAFLRNMMLIILIFVFFPFAYFSYSTSQLHLLWAGLIAVSAFRLIIGLFKVNKIN